MGVDDSCAFGVPFDMEFSNKSSPKASGLGCILFMVENVKFEVGSTILTFEFKVENITFEIVSKILAFKFKVENVKLEIGSKILAFEFKV